MIIGLVAFSTMNAQYENIQSDYVRPQNNQVPLESATLLSLGLGFGGYYPVPAAMYIENPSVSLSTERVVVKHAGPGTLNLEGMLAYKSIYSGYTDYYTGYNYEQHWNYYIVGTRLSYHLKSFSNKKMEPYAGIMLGYYINAFKFTSNDPDYAEPSDPGYSLKFSGTANLFAPSVFAGVRSWISKRSAIWIEAGYGYSSIAFGASYKI